MKATWRVGVLLVGVVACGGAREAPQSVVAKPRVEGPVVSVVVPAPSAAPVTPVVEEQEAVSEPVKLGFGLEAEEWRVPKEVEAELEGMREAYPAPARLRRLPDFLSVDQVVAMLPEEERDFVREELHQQLEGGENDALLGDFLDDGEQRLFALWVRGNLNQVLAVFDAGKLTGKRVIARGKPMLGEVLSERDGPRREILVERITTMSVCCLPMSLDVWRVSRRGVLTQVLSFPRGHVEVGPGQRWSSLNHFEFQDPRVVISSVLAGDQPAYELVFDPKSGKYQPTPATAKRLAGERRERERLKASGELLEE